MTIHREGRQLIGVAVITITILGGIVWLVLPWLVSLFLTIGFLALLGFLVQFFRNPVRKPPKGEDEVVAPADGKVVVKETVYEPEYLKQECLQVSIFMGPFDAHLNRVPVDGYLAYYRYLPGKYLAAYNPKSSELNEQNIIAWQATQGTIVMRQIAGVMARRIRFYLKKGQQAKKGDELGFIRFGSRMDILMPLHTNVRIDIGQQVYAGETVLANLASKPEV